MQELFQHFVCAGIVPAFFVCRNCSGTLCVQELIVPAFCVCRNCSSILCVQELFRHFMCAGIVPEFCVCRNCSSILCVQELFRHFGAVACVHRNCSGTLSGSMCRKYFGNRSAGTNILLVDQSNFTYIPVLGVLSLSTFLFSFVGNFTHYLHFCRKHTSYFLKSERKIN